jgi:hypothetical protein
MLTMTDTHLGRPHPEPGESRSLPGTEITQVGDEDHRCRLRHAQCPQPLILASVGTAPDRRVSGTPWVGRATEQVPSDDYGAVDLERHHLVRADQHFSAPRCRPTSGSGRGQRGTVQVAQG